MYLAKDSQSFGNKSQGGGELKEGKFAHVSAEEMKFRHSSRTCGSTPSVSSSSSEYLQKRFPALLNHTFEASEISEHYTARFAIQ